MATILEFQRKSEKSERPKGDGQPCQVVFFTGVRYERSSTERRTSEGSQRRAPEISANLTV